MKDDHFRDACGIFGIWGHPEAANLTYLGLYALQHRGQESAGIVSVNGGRMHVERAMGMVADVFGKKALRRLKGSRAIGHVRYSTAGESRLANAQPLKLDSYRGEMAICHNGNLINAHLVRHELERKGSIFTSTSDTEVILHLMARSGARTWEDGIVEALRQVDGAYSLLFLATDRLIAVRDPRGFRPLSIGELDGATVVASETCAFDLIDARFVRDVEPGEMVILSERGLESHHPLPKQEHAQCVFEYVYFSRPDSQVFGRNVSAVRRRLGVELAREAPVEADLVVPVPDSGVSAALGYAQEMKIQFEMGLVRNHYVGRTFIEPRQAIRHFGVKIKLNAVRTLLEGRRVILVDDSIVRGTTSRKIVSMVRDAGAREVHMRISCPPTVGPCYYGIDTPLRSELIASSHTVEEIRQHLRADSLTYLSLEGLQRAVGDGHSSFCYACYNDRYPVPFPRDDISQLRLFEKSR
ncbi:MAG: amidophosphoribosyltransferase [Acidobacteriota bacterium]